MRITNYGIMFKITSKHSTTYCAAQDVMRHIVFDNITKHLYVEVLKHGNSVSKCSLEIQDNEELISFLINALIDEAINEN